MTKNTTHMVELEQGKTVVIDLDETQIVTVVSDGGTVITETDAGVKTTEMGPGFHGSFGEDGKAKVTIHAGGDKTSYKVTFHQ